MRRFTKAAQKSMTKSNEYIQFNSNKDNITTDIIGVKLTLESVKKTHCAKNFVKFYKNY